MAIAKMQKIRIKMKKPQEMAINLPKVELFKNFPRQIFKIVYSVM